MFEVSALAHYRTTGTKTLSSFVDRSANNVQTNPNFTSHFLNLSTFLNVIWTVIVARHASFAQITCFFHRLNGSSSPVLTATSLSYGKAKNWTPTESKPLPRLR